MRPVFGIVLLVSSMTAGPLSLAGEQEGVLRVCADPNNLPFSNREGQGFENKIAELLAKDLGWKLEYTWFPQRMGFIRQTLRARGAGDEGFKCDLVMGVPVGYELAATTKPYYRSVWAMVYVKGRGLDSVSVPDDLAKLDPAKLKSLKLGVFAQTPPVDWLLKNNLWDQAVSYTRQSADPEEYPGQVVERDLAAGKIDVAFVWGPIAGYFSSKASMPMQVVPFRPEQGIKFDYPIAMGVRRGEKEWKDKIESMVERNKPEIQKILAEYGVPLVEEPAK
jgi:quinoprotein dehydrogenase-associated probable ABC transporter substrate-binding protein